MNSDQQTRNAEGAAAPPNVRLAADQVSAVILAGGFGVRIRHILPDLPKPMAPAAGKPFIEWIVRFLAAEGLEEVFVSTGYKGEVIEAHFASSPVPGIRVACIREATPLGTAGGFINAANLSGRSPLAWLVLNGDSLAFPKIADLFETLTRSRSAGILVGRRVPDTSRYGTLLTDSSGTLTGFAEKQPGSGLISSGIYLLRHELVERLPIGIPLSFEQSLFPALLQQRISLRVFEIDTPFLDIGTEESLRLAEDFIVANRHRFL